MWLNTNEAAEHTGVHPETIREKARRGEIPRYKFGGRWRFDSTELDKIIGKDNNQSQQEARQGDELCHVNSYNSKNAVKSGTTRLPRQMVSEYAEVLKLQTKTRPKS